MPDWSASMQRTYEYYTVNPYTWRDDKKLTFVKSSTIDRDDEVDTLGSASIDVGEPIDECYVRIYMVTIQNGVKERHPLGTFLIQTPSTGFDGMTETITADAYTPLIELKENPPPIGYFVAKNENVMDAAYRIVQDNVRAPVVKTANDTKLHYDFVADTDETWLAYSRDLIANAKYKFGLDEMGRILFLPIQDTASLQPVWTYDDGNSSILYPEITVDRDLYQIPNVIEVIYSNGPDNFHITVTNDDENSPTSTVNRGRRITHRVPNPDIGGTPTESMIREYAEQLLQEMSTLECTIGYSHGYCPVRPGDCVRLNYEKAGIKNVKAKVISQSIKCTPECPVSEKAVFTTKLWR